jgi:hypothetical protein
MHGFDLYPAPLSCVLSGSASLDQHKQLSDHCRPPRHERSSQACQQTGATPSLCSISSRFWSARSILFAATSCAWVSSFFFLLA